MNASASNEKKEGGGEPKRAFTTARIVALVVIGARRARPGLRPRQLGRRRGLGPVRCEGRRPDPRRLPVRDRAGQLRRRLRHPRRPGEPAQGGLAPDRASRHPHPRTLGGSRRADLPPPGRSRDHEHDVPGREPVRRQARRRAGRLPRRRRLVEARLSRGDLGARAGARLPDREGDAGRRGGVQGLRGAPPGRRLRPRRVHASPARRRPRRGPQGAGLRAHRPPQRERRDAHGDDLRLAVSAARSTAR